MLEIQHIPLLDGSFCLDQGITITSIRADRSHYYYTFFWKVKKVGCDYLVYDMQDSIVNLTAGMSGCHRLCSGFSCSHAFFLTSTVIRGIGVFGAIMSQMKHLPADKQHHEI